MVARWTRREALVLLAGAWSGAQSAGWRAEEIRRFPAPEARQAVAVDAEAFYAIANFVIAKYDKRSGRRLAEWRCERGKPLIHLNSGIVREGVLWCAHSNFPGMPMVSSIEMWDPGRLEHVGTHSFGIDAGSALWIDWRGGRRYVCFGHYAKTGAEPNRDPRWTQVVEYGPEWQRRQSWVLPAALFPRLGDHTISGAVFLSEDELLATGHDEKELYLLRFPPGGSELELHAVFASANTGQGLALDPSDPALLYGIDRPKGEVVVMRLRRPS